MHALSPSGLARRRYLTAAPLLALGMFVLPALADSSVRHASRRLLGTRVDIVTDGVPADAAAQAIDAAFAEMGRLERIMSRYRPDSQVSALARAAGKHPVPIAPELMSALRLASEVSARSHGAFDITIGAFEGWNFDPGHEQVPGQAELTQERPLVNYRDVVLDSTRGSAYLRRPGMKLDLGGIAKLPILQAGMDVLRQQGISNAMLNGGGDVLVSGRLQGRDWRIGLRDPLAPERLLGVVAITDGVVASSGDYERCFARDGQRYHHILDPRTGLPTRGPHGVTLVARKTSDVNGLGAAIMVAGTAAGRSLLGPMANVDALIVGPGSHPWMSEGMATRMRS